MHTLKMASRTKTNTEIIMEAHTIGEPKLYARVLTYLTLFLGEVNSS